MLKRKVTSPGINRMIASAATFLVLASAGIVHAQVVLVPPTPQIGSSNPATAEPSVTRPHTQPCIVPLLQNQQFADFDPKPISYSPPSNCPGPWAKVVFTADFTVTAGRQFDRTASIYLGHANIYYGTTAEPRATLSPSWHVERDVTDLSQIFKSTQTGQADLQNFVGVSGGVTYSGIIFANAALEFYPVSWRDPAPRTPDIVVPVNGIGGNAGTLNTSADAITQVLNLPTNVERVYLDVISQSQSGDEFWYICVPNDQTGNLRGCGNTAFRETEVSIDGQPAGVAPVYPWIYTGGIDTSLWEPIPGIQTLNFKPYRVDLTPFAGLLSDGSPHTIAVSVFNANSYFLATANLLAYTDRYKQKVTGGIISNTLTAAPNPVVTEDVTTPPTGTGHIGTVSVASNRQFAIRGYVNTSHGHVETTVEQTVDFLSSQQFNLGSSTIQNTKQTTTVDSRTSTRDAFLVDTVEQHFSYPLSIDRSRIRNSDGSGSQVTTIDQKNLFSETRSLDGFRYSEREKNETNNTTDMINTGTNGAPLGPSTIQVTQTYRADDSLGNCYSRTVTADSLKLTAVNDGQGCKGNNNHHQ